MDKFLEWYKLLKLTQEVTENLNRSITNWDWDQICNKKNYPKKKNADPYCFTDEFYQGRYLNTSSS